ncbi:alpha-1,3-mannosyl-glycoprotein 4-beta-N-acetylglucosaminyltransferase-like protein MGAT4E [Eumetopias jubatus]|uniref:alpha-1,3-mannosyl-glycoprotein 4-beta-N-acetylglucosaminyltransferase-like protein MGAT4E n=1 Tax=Eumetopias jubatus TaxID=34886 RepID=UPI001016F7EE|nr:alpha-1,3-mannosyl-glycoprotein 4-beta-N-acetylglucosaminyltransferase-like protein MGAT4E [Eumetopias jubatus]
MDKWRECPAAVHVDFLLQEPRPTDTMRCPVRRCFITSVGIGFLWLFITLKVPEEIEDDQNVMAIKGQEDNYDKRKDPRPLEDWQNLTFEYFKTIQQRRKRSKLRREGTCPSSHSQWQNWDRNLGFLTYEELLFLSPKAWLTVGISSVPQPDQRSLLYTLVSLFRASSKIEQKRLTVLVHLAHSDLARLRETVLHISTLFSPQILAGQLLLIHAPPDAYPSMDDMRKEAHHGEFYSKQNIDHAFLMSFATRLSEYFLLLEDNVFSAPDFITHIHWKVNTMRSNPWVLLEFSNTGILGKLFHSKDLPLLAHFLLLFYKEKPLDRLIPHFRTLLAQKNPIICRPFLFYHRFSYHISNDTQKATPVQKKNPYVPDNPPGAIFTDMKVFDVHFPWEAYTLDESFFWTHNVSAGNHLTVILNHPANLSKVQVLTGTIVDGKYALKKGQVELGYDPEGMPQYCTSFTLLGHLFEGQINQEIFLKRMGHNVSCVRLVVKADQVGGLIIRHIYLWEQNAKDMEAARSWR